MTVPKNTVEFAIEFRAAVCNLHNALMAFDGRHPAYSDTLYHLDELVKTHQEMFERFCPYKVGERVKLSKTLDIRPDSGWYGSRHFLIEGATATVIQTNFRDGLFCF